MSTTKPKKYTTVMACNAPPWKRGDLIFKDEPWMHALRTHETGIFCYYCLKMLGPFLGPVTHDNTPKLKNNRCSGCRFARYCSVDCQKADWSERHKFECAAVRRCVEKGTIRDRDHSDPMYLMMFKVVAKLMNPKTDKRQFLGPRVGERTFWDLGLGFGNFENIKTDYKLMEQVILIRKLIASDLDLPEQEFTKLLPVDEFVEIFARIKCNAFHITGETLHWVGIGVYINASTIEHSCKPNAAQFFDGKRLSIRATDQIESFWDLSISRVDELEPCLYRWFHLEKFFHITCGCEACADEGKKDAEIFALKCVNPNCDAKIPCDERADQPCPECGQQGKNRLKEFQNVHERYWTMTYKHAEYEDGYRNAAGLIDLGKDSMKKLYHPTNPLWIDVNISAGYNADHMHSPGAVRYYRTALELIRGRVSPIDPRIGWLAYRSTTPQFVNETDLSKSLKYLSEAKFILCDIWKADKMLYENTRDELQKFYVKRVGEEKFLQMLDFAQSLAASGEHLEPECKDVFPPVVEKLVRGPEGGMIWEYPM